MKRIKDIEWKEVLRNVSREYFILSVIILISYYLYKFENNNVSFSFALIMVYWQHHHKSETVTYQEVKSGAYTQAIHGKRLFQLLHIPTILVFMFLGSERTDFYSSLLVFITWFILTDMYRIRRSIYGNYISRWFGTSKISINNTKWRMHQADKDPFPSVPHMHAIDKPLKLDVYSGNMYDSKTGKYVCRAGKKDLIKLWKEKGNEFVHARKIYKENNPTYKLIEIPNHLVTQLSHLFECLKS